MHAPCAPHRLEALIRDACSAQLLQLYAARTLTRAGTPSNGDPAEAAVERLIAAEEEEWDGLLRQQEAQQACLRPDVPVIPNVVAPHHMLAL